MTPEDPQNVFYCVMRHFISGAKNISGGLQTAKIFSRVYCRKNLSRRSIMQKRAEFNHYKGRKKIFFTNFLGFRTSLDSRAHRAQLVDFTSRSSTFLVWPRDLHQQGKLLRISRTVIDGWRCLNTYRSSSTRHHSVSLHSPIAQKKEWLTIHFPFSISHFIRSANHRDFKFKESNAQEMRPQTSSKNLQRPRENQRRIWISQPSKKFTEFVILKFVI